MKKLIERFDRSYIINLRDRTDRRVEVIREFAKIGITLPHPKIGLYTAERPADQGVFPSLGARGIFESHRDVLRLAIERRLSNVLVFEDDVFFRDIPEHAIDGMLSELGRQPWDIIYFGYLFPSESTLSGPLAQSEILTIGSHFCALNGPFIRYIAQYMDDCEKRPPRHRLGGPMSRDGVFNHVRLINPDVRVLLAVPNLAVQRSSRTDLGPLKFYDRVPWMRPVTGRLRGVKNWIRSLETRQR